MPITIRSQLAASIAAVLAVSLTSFSTPAQAQRKAAMLEEVVVTARKRDESQQDVPLAVTAVTGEEMRANNISTIADIAKIAPGLDQREGRKQGAFTIRGVGQQRINDVAADPGVGVYMDGIFLARNDSQLLDTLALQSVQVLRGPQGTLFGKNSVGGAILVSTKDPEDDMAISINSRLDTLGQEDVRIAIDVPLIENKLWSKLTLGSVQSDGYAEDVDTGSGMGDDDRLVAALQLLWDINEDASLKTLAYFNKQQENIPPHYCQQVTTVGALSFARAPGREESYNEACTAAEALIGEEKVDHENVASEFSSRDALFGATLTWDAGPLVFKSISSLVLKGESFADFDFDATDLLAIRSVAYVQEQLKRQGVYDDEGSRRTLGQEFQISGLAFDDKLSYTLGVFGSWESIDKLLVGQSSTEEGWLGFESIPGVPSPNDFCGFTPEDCLYVRGVHDSSISSYDNTSYAFFSQAAYELTSSLQITAGLRYSYEERKIKFEAFGSQSIPTTDAVIAPPGGLGGIFGNIPITVMTESQFNMLEGVEIELSRPGDIQKDEVDFERLSPMLSVAWAASDHFSVDSIDSLMLYASISEGFKSGGFNVLADSTNTFEPEFVVATEIGIKMDALQRRLRFNAAAYHSDYEDIQVVVAQISALGAPVITTNNAGLAKIQGFEFELTWLVNEALMLTASGNYIDAETLVYDDEVLDPVTFEPRPVDRSDEPFAFLPEYVYNLSARYSLPTDIGDFDFVLSRNTRADQYIGGDATAGLPQFRDAATIDGFSTWSGRVTWTPWEDRRLTLALYGNNLSDEEYVATGTAVYSGFGTNSFTLGKKRHFGLELNYELR